MSERAVTVSGEAVLAARLAYAKAFRQMQYEDARVERALQEGSTVVVSELLGDLIRIFGIHQELPRAMGLDEHVAGIQSCIDHLAAYKLCVDEETE